MSIWFGNPSTADMSSMDEGTMVEHLGIELVEVKSNSLIGKMPVDHRTFQPMKILHGGASVVLAETLGSIASNFVVEPGVAMCVGLAINANHIRPVSSGYVYGEATAVHLGKTTHIWNIEIKNEQGKITCVCRLTMAVKYINEIG